MVVLPVPPFPAMAMLFVINILHLIVYSSPKNYGTDYNEPNLTVNSDDTNIYFGDKDNSLLVKSPMVGYHDKKPVIQYNNVYEIPGIAGLTRVFDRHTILGNKEADLLESIDHRENC